MVITEPYNCFCYSLTSAMTECESNTYQHMIFHPDNEEDD